MNPYLVIVLLFAAVVALVFIVIDITSEKNGGRRTAGVKPAKATRSSGKSAVKAAPAAAAPPVPPATGTPESDDPFDYITDICISRGWQLVSPGTYKKGDVVLIYSDKRLIGSSAALVEVAERSDVYCAKMADIAYCVRSGVSGSTKSPVMILTCRPFGTPGSR